MSAEFEDIAEQFAIVTFHNNGHVKTRQDLVARLDHLQTGKWKDHPMPFPVLLDTTGATYEQFSVDLLPTMFQVNPDGTLQRCRTVEEVRAALDRLRAESSSRQDDTPGETDSGK